MDISAGVLVREGKVVRRGPRQVNIQSTFVFSFSLLFFVCKFLFKATATIFKKTCRLWIEYCILIDRPKY